MPYGVGAVIGLAFQNSWGTQASTNSLHWMPFMGETIGKNLPPLISENMHGHYDQGDTYSGPQTVDGDIRAEAQPIPLGALVTAVMGQVTSVSTQSMYRHAFTPRTTDHSVSSANRPVSIYKWLGEAEDPQLFYDCNGTLLELDVAEGGFLSVRADFVGGQRTTVNSVAHTADEGQRFTWNVASIQLGGSANVDFTRLQISYNEALSAKHTINNSQAPSRIKRDGARVVNISGTLKFEDRTEMDLYFAETTQAMIVNLVNGESDWVKITLPDVRYEEFRADADGPGEVEADFTGRALYHAGSGTSIEIQVQNDQAAYY